MRQTLVPALGALLLLAPLLAGCSDPADASDPIVEDPEPARRLRLDPPGNLSFAAPVILEEQQGGAEPSVAVAPDGTIYVTTPGWLWRSDDGGLTYQALGTPVCPFNAPACGPLEETQAPVRGFGDADLWVNPDGRVHWLGLFDGDNAIPYQVSEDRGETWSEVVDLAGDDSGDREWITGRADGTLFAAWRNFPESGDAKIVVRASYDGGESWTEASDVADDTRQGGVAVDPSSNALALAYDANGPVSVARSSDNGTTWESTLVADNGFLGHIFPVLAFDGNGTLYLAYSADPDGSFGMDGTTNRPMEHPNVYLHVSHDKGETWSDAVQVNPPGSTAWFPWIAAGSQGRLVVTWYQNDLGLPRQLADSVYVMAAVSLDADYPDPRFTVTRVSPDPIHRGPECRENPAVCTRSLLDFFEVAIAPDGRAVVTWAQDVWPSGRSRVGVAVVESGPDLLAPAVLEPAQPANG